MPHLETLDMVLKYEYFDAIQAGTKKFELREDNLYWQRRLNGADYKRIRLRRGYTKTSIDLPYRGYIPAIIIHQHFGPKPIMVYAIRLTDDEEGDVEGDLCNRVDGAGEMCAGALDCAPVENCSCHLGGAPCGACTTDRTFCPSCDWSALDE